MKKLSLIAMFLGLGLFSIGCESKTEEAVEAQHDAAEETSEAHAAHDAAAAGAETQENAGEEADEAAEANADAAEATSEAAAEEGAAPVAPATPE